MPIWLAPATEGNNGMLTTMKQGLLRGITAATLATLLLVGPLPLAAFAAGMAGTVVISGTVRSAADGKPAPGAQVYAVHLDTKQVFKSGPSDADGKYSIPGLPFGYYDIAVLDASGLYLANRVINAPAGEKQEISLSLGPPQPEDTEWWSAEPDRRIPGLDRVPDGVARIIEGKPPKGGLATAQAGTKEAAAATTAAKTATGLKAASWLVPLLGGAGIIVLGALADDDDEQDPEASSFE